MGDFNIGKLGKINVYYNQLTTMFYTLNISTLSLKVTLDTGVGSHHYC